MGSPKLIIISTIILITIVCLEFTFIKFEWFDYVPRIGILFHIAGGCFSGLLLYAFCMTSLKITPILVQLIFVMGSAAIAAVSWEGFEWGVGIVLTKKFQGSINNIMLDLFTGMVGGILACIWVYVMHINDLKSSHN